MPPIAQILPARAPHEAPCPQSAAPRRLARLFAVTFLLLAGLWLMLARAVLDGGAIVQLDAALAQAMQNAWTPASLAVFTRFTALGDSGVGTALLGLGALWAILLRRPGLVWGLLASAGAELATVSMAKHAFGRPRPVLGYFMETSGSFPSGHAAFGVAFYGMLAYILWRLGLLRPVAAVLLGAATAFLIGLSRLYLVSHYLSDVLAGWVLGGMCLVLGIALAEWRLRATVTPLPRLPRWKSGLAGLISLGLIGYAGLCDARFDKALRSPSGLVVAASEAPAEF
ncbi:phosphatase PAP2 family protein [Rhodobacter lacus]|uniref:Phosphatase PAP2 family protein n=1 Tax=Rhodobacter lacus TaxID=1641972 RepID=A0ABW5A4X2_9RHOB